MKIAISSIENNTDSKMNPRFGRTDYFYIFDTQTSTGYFIDNQNKDAAQGAGIASAQTIILEKAEAVITGRFGPKAQSVLEKANIKLFMGNEEQSLSENLEAFKQGKLAEL